MNRFIAACNLRCLMALLMAMGFAGAVAAQEKFPVRPIELIVPWGPGGRADPGKLKIATLGFGSVDDFSLKTIEAKGIKFVQVPFSKPSERYVSILGGHADALYEQAGDVGSFLHGKQMRPILMFGDTRS